jgi:hypothetical protein
MSGLERTDSSRTSRQSEKCPGRCWLGSLRARIFTQERGAATADRLAPRPLHPGVRPGDRTAPGELPAGVLPSRADRGCGAHDRPREARGALTMDAYDAIITRTGAGGDALAQHFAPSGKRVLLPERGDWLLRELPLAPACLHEERDRGGRVRTSGRYLTVRHGSGHVGVEHRLPGPARQPPGRERESLSNHRGGEPGAHRDRQRAPRRRSPAHAADLTRGER